jgi:hypothetical protein
MAKVEVLHCKDAQFILKKKSSKKTRTHKTKLEKNI